MHRPQRSPAERLDRTLENLESFASRGNPWATRLARIKTREALDAASDHRDVLRRHAPAPAPHMALTLVRPA